MLVLRERAAGETGSSPTLPSPVESLEEYTNPKVDVIVPTASIDRWPANESIKWNATYYTTLKYPRIRFVPIESSGPDFSFARSVNRGIRSARDDALVFLVNDDCFLDLGWPMAFKSAISCHPKGIYGALLRFPPKTRDGNQFSGRAAWNHWRPAYQHAGGFIPTTTRERISGLLRFSLWNGAPLWTFRQLRYVLAGDGFRFPGHYHSLRAGRRINLVTAAAMMLTPELIDRVGYFDEDFPLGFEDIDYCLRAMQAGFDPCLVSDATGQHYESLTTRHLEARKRESYRIFCEKWPVERIRETIGDHRGLVHPLYCGCAEMDYES